MNKHCRENGIRFIAADVRGVFAYMFNDFGDSFTVYDKDGQEPVVCMLENVTSAEKAQVNVHPDARHGMSDGDWVTFVEVEGMTELNGCEPMQISDTRPFSFLIGDTREFGAYKSAGYVKQVKVPSEMSFKVRRVCFSHSLTVTHLLTHPPPVSLSRLSSPLRRSCSTLT
jgi:ubiquitin-activating enzyme E1